MRARTCFGAVVAIAVAVLMSPMQEQVSAQSGARVLISEYRLRGPNGPNDEFIQLFNGFLKIFEFFSQVFLAFVKGFIILGIFVT